MDIRLKTVRSITAASGGHLVAKIVDVGKNIVLARLLAPEDFGLVALALFLVDWMKQVGPGGLYEAVIQRKERDERIVQTGFTFSLITSGLVFGIVWMGADSYGNIYGDQQIELLVKVLSFSIIARALGFVPEATLVRNLDFRERVTAELAAGIIGAVVAVSLAIGGYGYWSIVGGLLAKSLVDLCLLYVVRPSRVRLVFDFPVGRGLFAFGVQVVLTSFLAFLVNRLPDALIGQMLGTAVLGFYVVAFRWGNVVAIDIAEVLGRVLYPAFSLVQREPGKVRGGYLKALKYLSIAIFPCSFGMAAVAPEFIKVVLGAKWEMAVVPLQLLCLAALMRSLGYVGGAARRAVGRPEITNYILVMQVVIMSALLVPLTYWNGLIGASIAVGLTSVGVTMGIVYVDGMLFGIEVRDFIAVVKHPFLGSLIMVGLMEMERVVFGGVNEAVLLIMFLSTGILSYCMYALWSCPEFNARSVGFHLGELFRQ